MNRKLLIIICVVVLLLGGGGAYYFLVMAKETPPLEEEFEEGEEFEEDAEEDDAEDAEEDDAENIDGPLMEPFTVNLADPGGRRYLRCTVRLKLYDEEALEHLETHMPEVRDAAIIHLSGKTIENILSPEGKIALREELLAQLNTALEFENNRGITKIFFTEFLVQ